MTTALPAWRLLNIAAKRRSKAVEFVGLSPSLMSASGQTGTNWRAQKTSAYRYEPEMIESFVY